MKTAHVISFILISAFSVNVLAQEYPITMNPSESKEETQAALSWYQQRTILEDKLNFVAPDSSEALNLLSQIQVLDNAVIKC